MKTFVLFDEELLEEFNRPHHILSQELSDAAFERALRSLSNAVFGIKENSSFSTSFFGGGRAWGTFSSTKNSSTKNSWRLPQNGFLSSFQFASKTALERERRVLSNAVSESS